MKENHASTKQLLHATNIEVFAEVKLQTEDNGIKLP